MDNYIWPVLLLTVAALILIFGFFKSPKCASKRPASKSIIILEMLFVLILNGTLIYQLHSRLSIQSPDIDYSVYITLYLLTLCVVSGLIIQRRTINALLITLCAGGLFFVQVDVYRKNCREVWSKQTRTLNTFKLAFTTQNTFLKHVNLFINGQYFGSFGEANQLDLNNDYQAVILSLDKLNALPEPTGEESWYKDIKAQKYGFTFHPPVGKFEAPNKAYSITTPILNEGRIYYAHLTYKGKPVVHKYHRGSSHDRFNGNHSRVRYGDEKYTHLVQSNISLGIDQSRILNNFLRTNTLKNVKKVQQLFIIPQFYKELDQDQKREFYKHYLLNSIITDKSTRSPTQVFKQLVKNITDIGHLDSVILETNLNPLTAQFEIDFLLDQFKVAYTQVRRHIYYRSYGNKARVYIDRVSPEEAELWVSLISLWLKYDRATTDQKERIRDTILSNSKSFDLVTFSAVMNGAFDPYIISKFEEKSVIFADIRALPKKYRYLFDDAGINKWFAEVIKLKSAEARRFQKSQMPLIMDAIPRILVKNQNRMSPLYGAIEPLLYSSLKEEFAKNHVFELLESYSKYTKKSGLTQQQWAILDRLQPYTTPEMYYSVFQRNFFDPEVKAPQVVTPGGLKVLRLIEQFAQIHESSSSDDYKAFFAKNREQLEYAEAREKEKLEREQRRLAREKEKLEREQRQSDKEKEKDHGWITH